MKLLNLFAAVLIGGLSFSVSANAATCSVAPYSGFCSSTVGGLSSVSDSYSFDASDVEVDVLDGYLSQHSEISITYTSSLGFPDVVNYIAEMGNANSHGSWSSSSVSQSGGGDFNGSISASFLGNVATIVIANFASEARYFYSEIYNIPSGDGNITVSYTATPLPPAFLLFTSGLVAMAGFAARKKVRA